MIRGLKKFIDVIDEIEEGLVRIELAGDTIEVLNYINEISDSYYFYRFKQNISYFEYISNLLLPDHKDKPLLDKITLFKEKFKLC